MCKGTRCRCVSGVFLGVFCGFQLVFVLFWGVGFLAFVWFSLDFCLEFGYTVDLSLWHGA